VLTVITSDGAEATAVAIDPSECKNSHAYKCSNTDTSRYLRAIFLCDSASDVSDLGLVDVDFESILLFRDWLKTATVDISHLPEKAVQPGSPNRTDAIFHRLGDAWILGEKIHAKSFCNAATDKIFSIGVGLLDDQTTAKTLHSLLKRASQGSKLQRLLTDVEADMAKSHGADASKDSMQQQFEGNRRTTRTLRREKAVEAQEYYYV
jgi:hypothetical protein